MVLGINQTIGLVVVIISVFTYFTVKNSLIYSNDPVRSLEKNEYILLIAITSAQDHFEQRVSIRRTWLKLISNEDIKYYFLVGNLFCPVPPKYRLSPLSCEEWKPLIDHSVTSETVYTTLDQDDNCFRVKHESNIYMKGFTFILNHKIVVHKFGISSYFLDHCSGSVQLILTDAISLNQIIMSTFTANNSETGDSIIWNKIPRTILPSGFEGQLIIDGNCSLEKSDNDSIKLALGDKTNMIRFLLNINSENKTFSYSKNVCMNVGFSFTIKDVNSIHNAIRERKEEWLKWEKHIKEMSNKLETEMTTYGDILLLNIIDTYNNLPKKMLQFYQWLSPSDYKYVLKTDDDVFIDVPKVVSELKTDEDKTWSWWSCFRINWPVRRAGKWRELDLDLTVYPDFPSGAGYILNNDVVTYIHKNTKRLASNVQGEDVALGLWVHKLKPKMHVGYQCHWSCNSDCQENVCNVMELSVSDMMSVWEQYLACNNSLKCFC